MLMIFWESAEFLVFLFELTILFKYLKSILALKCNKYAVFWIFITSIVSYIITLQNINGISKTLLVYFIVFVIIYILFNGGFFNKIIAFATFMIINIAIENAVVFMFVFILDIPIALISDGMESNIFIRLTAIIFAKVFLYLIISIYINRKNNKKNTYRIQLNNNLLIGMTMFLLLIIFITSLVLNIYLQINELRDNVLSTIYLLVISFGGLCILTIYIYEIILNESEKQMKLKLQLQKKENEYKYNQEIAFTVDSIRGIKHDMSNHLAVISGYIQSDNCNKAKEYIEKLSHPMGNVNSLLDINHHAISSILYVKTILAKSNDIIIRTDIDIHKDIYIDDMDMTIILGNILDNAIEASRELGDEEKYIGITIKMLRDYLILDCTNTMNPHKINFNNNKMTTTKKDYVNHGIGLKNVEHVVNKYDGYMDIGIIEDKFTINITLPNKYI